MKYTDKAQETVNALLARFQSGDIAPIIEVATIHLTPEEQRAALPAMKWSFRNQVIALFQTGQTDCRGYRQWQEVGRQVKAGAHAAYILGPIMIKDETDKEHSALIGFKSIPVFSVDDTEGEPLPEYKAPERPLPPLSEVAKAWGLSITWGEAKGYYGFYSGQARVIHLATESEKTFFHELAHAAHERIEGKLKGGQDPRQELVADFCAGVLMQVYGLKDMSGNVWNYIKGYNPKDPIKAIMSSLDIIGKVLDLILETSASLNPSAL